MISMVYRALLDGFDRPQVAKMANFGDFGVGWCRIPLILLERRATIEFSRRSWIVAPDTAFAGNIYDSQIMQRVKFNSGQRNQVRVVLKQSDREMASIFRKYGINPNAKPVFKKLRGASSELEAVEAREKLGKTGSITDHSKSDRSYRAMANLLTRLQNCRCKYSHC